MRAAAKAMIELLGRTHGKTGGFFIMKGTQTHEVCATFFELDVLAHNVNDVNAGKQILNKGLGDQLTILKQGNQTYAAFSRASVSRHAAISAGQAPPLPKQKPPSCQRVRPVLA